MNENTPKIEVTPTPQNLDSLPNVGANPVVSGPITTIPTNPTGTQAVPTDFLNGTETANKDALYADLFEKNSDGELIRSQKTKRSALEIFTNIMGFVTPILLIAAILGAVHAFIRSQETNAWAENFQFLCGYLNYDVNTEDPAYDCQTPTFIANDVAERTKKLEKDIVEQLALYIPLKISTAAANASAESTKAREVYSQKVNANEIISQFNKIRKKAQSAGIENIICDSMNISDNNKISVQCSAYGNAIGASDIRQLGSSRIEAISFLERLSDTQNSQFILNTPPTTLSVESTEKQENVPAIYKTKTTFTISLTYLPNQIQI